MSFNVMNHQLFRCKCGNCLNAGQLVLSCLAPAIIVECFDMLPGAMQLDLAESMTQNQHPLCKSALQYLQYRNIAQTWDLPTNHFIHHWPFKSDFRILFLFFFFGGIPARQNCLEMRKRSSAAPSCTSNSWLRSKASAALRGRSCLLPPAETRPASGAMSPKRTQKKGNWLGT